MLTLALNGEEVPPIEVLGEDGETVLDTLLSPVEIRCDSSGFLFLLITYAKGQEDAIKLSFEVLHRVVQEWFPIQCISFDGSDFSLTPFDITLTGDDEVPKKFRIPIGSKGGNYLPVLSLSDIKVRMTITPIGDEDDGTVDIIAHSDNAYT
jgi:hypothetical protein